MGTVTGECVNTLRGHTGVLASVTSLCLLGDGATLASGSEDNTIRFWNTVTGECVNTLRGHNSVVYALCLLGDGVTLASGSRDRAIRFWNTVTGECVNTLRGHNSFVYSLCLLGDGATLASGTEDNTIRLRDSFDIHPDAGFIRPCWRLRAVSRALRDVTANQRPSTAPSCELVINLVECHRSQRG